MPAPLEQDTPYDLMDRKSFGLRLREVRFAVGITQVELARLLDETSANVSRWESGEMEFPSWRVPELAKALGVKPSAFFRDPGPDVPEPGRGGLRGKPKPAADEPTTRPAKPRRGRPRRDDD